jgi:hypothetical protein
MYGEVDGDVAGSGPLSIAVRGEARMGSGREFLRGGSGRDEMGTHKEKKEGGRWRVTPHRQNAERPGIATALHVVYLLFFKSLSGSVALHFYPIIVSLPLNIRSLEIYVFLHAAVSSNCP